ncbi:MAG: beta-N-acetylhexosaminidase [Rikenellaceae bacterium]
MKNLLVALFVLVGVCASAQNSEIQIIPKPQTLEAGSGVFVLAKKSTIAISAQEAASAAQFLKDIIETSSSKKVDISTGNSIDGAINLILDETYNPSNTESYKLTVSPSKIVIVANDKAGLFYGVQSLRQLMPATIESDVKLKENSVIEIPSVTIVDEPRFAWRGYMKDVSRTFYSVDVIKKYLDVMALYKMNVFHFHLTDDQGWRVEMKQYPELTTPLTTQFHEKYNQPSERSGYYTQEQIKDIVAYAAERNITVVPEIDVPGHSWPTLLVYPELGVNDNHEPFHVFPFLSAWDNWGNQFTPNSLDPTSEKVYTFLDNVFTEIAELFPSVYIHFGGDEVMHHFWTQQEHVQKFMKDNDMQNVTQLQNYFVERVAEIIVSKGRKPIGWNDVLKDPTLTKETAIMCWLGENAIKQAANDGYYSVATPSLPLYLDITQEDRNDGTMCDLNYAAINSIKAIYNYNPTKGVSQDKQHFVLGVQANMWPAVPQEVKDVNVQNFPRLFAVAEIGWSSEDSKDFSEFSSRVEEAKKRLDVLKIDYYREGGYIVNQWTPEDVKSDFTTVEWDVTSKVYASGRAIAGFYATKGENSIEIQSVELLENGKVISSDSHTSMSQVKKNIFRPYNYDLEVEKYNPKSKYTIQVTFKGDKGTDSYGNVTFNLSPYVPFSVVEK